MLEVFTKLICFILMAVTGFYVIKIITKRDVKIFNLRSILLLSILVIVPLSMYNIQYTSLYTITVFMLDIIIYKFIFKLTIEESIISCSIFMISLFFSDLIISLLFRIFVSAQEIRTNPIISISANATISLMCSMVINIKVIRLQIQKFYKNVVNKKTLTNIIFFILIIIDFSYLAYNIINSKTYNINYFVNSIAMIIFIVIAYMFIKNKNSFNQLSDEYDSLFSYVQNFEEWIEKEQLNRHEYKNQLAVLRCLTKEKKVKEKIDEILEDNINIEGEVVHQLKFLPKGGLKGLMYYKSVIAQKNKINLTVDVSIERKSILDKLSEKDMRVLCKLIGIYFDNAIEAARETRKKNVLIEVYELKDKVNIVISNTFKKTKNFDKRNEKGVSSKGEGHGNGLYFAKNLISKNEWISGRQDIIDGYYIQELSIKKLG